MSILIDVIIRGTEMEDKYPPLEPSSNKFRILLPFFVAPRADPLSKLARRLRQIANANGAKLRFDKGEALYSDWGLSERCIREPRVKLGILDISSSGGGRFSPARGPGTG